MGGEEKLRPSQGVVKVVHHCRSRWKVCESVMVSWSPRTVVLMSIIRLRNVRPAGTTLAARLRVPISDRRSC